MAVPGSGRTSAPAPAGPPGGGVRRRLGLPALAEARRRLVGVCERPAPARATSPTRSRPTPPSRSRSCAPPTTATARPAGPPVCDRRSKRCGRTGCAMLAAHRDLRRARAAGRLVGRHERFAATGSRSARGRADRRGGPPPQREELASRPSPRRRQARAGRALRGRAPRQPVGDLPRSGSHRAPRARDRPRPGRRGADPALGAACGVATAVERHHSADADGHAAAIRLADLIVHHAAGDPVAPTRCARPPTRWRSTAPRCGR